MMSNSVYHSITTIVHAKVWREGEFNPDEQKGKARKRPEHGDLQVERQSCKNECGDYEKWVRFSMHFNKRSDHLHIVHWET